ncbi:hypothetical protein LPN04_29900 [Rugamonas sp. A1-17]|nr:hypothetical protein [Rugamonas sp. A1-17]
MFTHIPTQQNTIKPSTFVLSFLIIFFGASIALFVAYPVSQLPPLAIAMLLAYPTSAAVFISTIIYKSPLTHSDARNCSLFCALLVVIVAAAIVGMHGKLGL